MLMNAILWKSSLKILLHMHTISQEVNAKKMLGITMRVAQNFLL